ncbi:DUF3018 family protein [Vibrio kagoshimensis]|uniref:antitoxin MazE-like protein n=1 Tax=Vibrio kagoshimensis TaxID=2910244 RepID=UPI003D1DE715
MSRNADYEKRMRDLGFKKITLWIPDSMSAEFHQCASACRVRPTLVLSTLRDSATGRFVSIERFNAPSPVTQKR